PGRPGPDQPVVPLDDQPPFCTRTQEVALTTQPASPHTAFQQLPLVDISPLYSDDPLERQRGAEQLGKAAREVGFFYVTGHHVPGTAIERLVSRSKAYFAQPLAEKMRHYIGQSSNHSGYVPEGEEQFDPNI